MFHLHQRRPTEWILPPPLSLSLSPCLMAIALSKSSRRHPGLGFAQLLLFLLYLHAASLGSAHIHFSRSVSLMVQLYSCTDTVSVLKNSCFVLSERSDFHMVDNLSIAFHALLMCMLTSLSVDEILLPRYVNWSNNFSSEEFLFYFIEEIIFPYGR